MPTRPEGTEVKKGVSPSILAPLSCAGAGCTKASASADVANCGIRVSNLVETTTVRDKVGSADMTSRRVVALVQSLLSSRHKMMYSGVCIFCRTMASTCCDAVCNADVFLPGAAEMRPTSVSTLFSILCTARAVAL